MTKAAPASVSGLSGSRPTTGTPSLRCIGTAFGFDDAARGLVMLDSLMIAHGSAAVYVLCLDEASEHAVHDRCPQARILRTPAPAANPDGMPAHLHDLVAADAPDAASITWVSPSVFFYRAVDELLADDDAPVTVVGAPPLPHLPPSWITWRTGDLAKDGAGRPRRPSSRGLGLDAAMDATLSLHDEETDGGEPILNGEPLVFVDFAPVAIHRSGLWQFTGPISPDGPVYRLAEAYAARTGHVLDSLAGSAGADTPPADRCFSALPARRILNAVTQRAEDEAIVTAAAAHWGGAGLVLAEGLSEELSARDDFIARYAGICRGGCLFHAVPVTLRRPTMVLRSPDGREPASRAILNEGEARLLFARHGLRVQRVWQCPRTGLDEWGITVKSFLCTPDPEKTPDSPLLLNIGCGDHFHEGWFNMDIASRHYGVLIHDAAAGLPFPDRQFDGLYQSHVLEHLPRDAAPSLLRECYRVLKPGGVLRVVVPDLEGIARAYLEALEAAIAGEAGAAERYDWMVVELLDQLVRHESEGIMGRRLSQLSPSSAGHVVKRIGRQGCGSSRRPQPAPWWAPGYPPPRRQSFEVVGRFRLSGEVHQWMYDRYSLAGLLALAGFRDIRLRTAADSALPSFSAAALDLDGDGAPRKPDSLYMEGVKPR